MSELTVAWPGHKSSSPEEAAEPKLTVVINSTEESKVLHAFGDEMTVLLSGADTGGKIAMCLSVTPPESGPPPHHHLNEDEWFLPLEGEVEFLIDGEWQAVAAGTAVYIPRGTVHTFRNSANEPLKMLIQTTPAGFETFFERCAEEFAKPGPPNMPRIIEISAEHGIHYIMD